MIKNGKKQIACWLFSQRTGSTQPCDHIVHILLNALDQMRAFNEMLKKEIQKSNVSLITNYGTKENTICPLTNCITPGSIMLSESLGPLVSKPSSCAHIRIYRYIYPPPWQTVIQDTIFYTSKSKVDKKSILDSNTVDVLRKAKNNLSVNCKQ